MSLGVIATICIIGVLYIHIIFHINTSNHMDIYEMILPINSVLENVCNLKQPVVFTHSDKLILQSNIDNIPGAFNVNVHTEHKTRQVTLSKALHQFESSNCSTHHNGDFIKETKFDRYYKTINDALCPPLVTSTVYDVMFGSLDHTTKLRYHTSCRNFIIVTAGTISIKLAPPKNGTFFNVISNHEIGDYYSDINPWTTKKKLFISASIGVGQLIYIPAYWWYSIKLEKDSRISFIHYKTIMNEVAILPNTLYGIIPRQNISLIPKYKSTN